MYLYTYVPPRTGFIRAPSNTKKKKNNINTTDRVLNDYGGIYIDDVCLIIILFLYIRRIYYIIYGLAAVILFFVFRRRYYYYYYLYFLFFIFIFVSLLFLHHDFLCVFPPLIPRCTPHTRYCYTAAAAAAPCHSARSSAAERYRRGRQPHVHRGPMAAADVRPEQRSDNLLQGDGHGKWHVRLGSKPVPGGERDSVHAGRAATVDRVQDLGAGWHFRRRRSFLFPVNGSHSRRR